MEWDTLHKSKREDDTKQRLHVIHDRGMMGVREEPEGSLEPELGEP